MVQKLPGGIEFGLDQRAGVTTVTGSAPLRLRWIIPSLHKGSKMAKLSKQRLQLFFMTIIIIITLMSCSNWVVNLNVDFSSGFEVEQGQLVLDLIWR